MVALKAEFQHELIIYWRYLFNSVSDLALTILMFMGIFWGNNSINRGTIRRSLSALAIGFTLWTIIQSTVSVLGSDTMNNAKSGALQQLYLMSISSEKLFFNRSMVNIIISFRQSVTVCLALMPFIGQWINFIIMVIWPAIFPLVTLLGLGYLIISLVLGFRRIRTFLVICQYLYLRILLAQSKKVDLLVKNMADFLSLIPVVNWMGLIIGGLAYNFKYYLSFSIFSSIIWLLIGLFVFEGVNKIVKK